MKLVFHPLAEAEHLEQVTWYQTRQAGLGGRYLDDVARALTLICEGPLQFPVVREPSLRRLVLKQFPLSVLFRERNGSIEILAIAPHRRRPGYWRNRI